ncbi:MAG: hypothetical protein DIJKHBIC_01457 [Thermoanaerobaculia bacterium]|nr:hypothetical protein [Thermoanaerobaculia bacterium]
MTRARAVFARTGLEIIPAPTDHNALDGRPKPWVLGFWPDTSSLEGSEAALHELAGLLYYRIRGWL